MSQFPNQTAMLQGGGLQFGVLGQIDARKPSPAKEWAVGYVGVSATGVPCVRIEVDGRGGCLEQDEAVRLARAILAAAGAA